ncbi:helix-turn-helix domain-containing protein [Bradyrhizobium sp. 1(2017)]|jgi:AraC family transcriptional regulator|uniref:helix-turn-helix domain-containing protein n=1 Tax=Bradyrhizobium sp. 1(2017) TaxID=1404888 RepID=UPI00140ECAD4|nr:helix-turn-helix domain-containing protein [Bradyrhizobium sp. 1(2017)]QIO30401.1 AraC family transcriptional regulator [Bradyrhizobium sp. 1(2017)]
MSWSGVSFRRPSQTSPHARLHRHRHERSMRMLHDTSDSIISIAAALGCCSRATFAAFQDADRQEPSDWRRRRR